MFVQNQYIEKLYNRFIKGNNTLVYPFKKEKNIG